MFVPGNLNHNKNKNKNLLEFANKPIQFQINLADLN